MSNGSILIIEDDPDIAEIIEYTLARDGYETRVADCAATAFRYIRSSLPDLVTLDIMLPGSDGMEILRRIRNDRDTANLPVIMVTAKDDDVDQVVGFEFGADDYVTKPFSPRVLLARIKQLLRRKNIRAESELLRCGDLEVNPLAYSTKYRGQTINLTKAEFKLLSSLIERPGWVFTREQLLEVTSQGIDVAERAIDMQIVGLRRHLGAAGKLIKTVRGVGYKLEA